VYDLQYYESGLWQDLESLTEGVRDYGNIRVERNYVTTHANDGIEDLKMFLSHTRVFDRTVINEDSYQGTFAIVHGFAENSDIHLESAIQFALNGFDVHLIDLRGKGLSGGFRMVNNRIHDYHYDVSALLRQCNPNLPLYLYAHSMGGLAIISYLCNNPQLNISGVILSAPFLNFSETQKVDEFKKASVKFLSQHMDVSHFQKLNHLKEFVVNPGLPTHMICSDKIVYKEFLQNRKIMPFMSLKLINSMMEFFEDMPLNIKK
jgi:alpha-beta hydrolase superfamily lysophospholipase